jgi:hypothetical protein
VNAYAVAKTGDGRFLALDESVVAVAALGPPRGARGSHPLRVILTSRGRVVGFNAGRGRQIFSVNLDELQAITTSVEHALSFLGTRLFRLQLALKDGSSVTLQTSGISTTRRAKTLAGAINDALRDSQ